MTIASGPKFSEQSGIVHGLGIVSSWVQADPRDKEPKKRKATLQLNKHIMDCVIQEMMVKSLCDMN